MSIDLSGFIMDSYEDVKPYFDELLAREVKTKEETLQWLADYDMISAHITEDSNRRYIYQSGDTKNEDYKKKYEEYILEIAPKLQEVSNLMNQKMISLPYIEQLEKEDEAYEIMTRNVKQAIKMHRDENIPLEVELADLEKQYSELTGGMMIEYDGKMLTLQQAGIYLQNTDRAVRKEVYEKIQDRRLQDAEKIDDIYTKQIQLREQIAKNAGYPSFVEYQWDNFTRFDYTQDDVFSFHEGMRKYIVPLAEKIYRKKAKNLGLEKLAPYDLAATPIGDTPLHPFETADELLEKAIAMMNQLSPLFAERLHKMKTGGFFDLASREGKRGGGYQTDLPLSKSPFIFMNAVGTQRDIETILHEAGHAMHSFAMQPLPLSFQGITMEIAEVSSMSMELLTLDGYSVFYSNPQELQKAKAELLEGIIGVLPWISIVDIFQYWVYKNPTHTIEERDTKMQELLEIYHPWIDYTDYSISAKKRWQAQLHIIEHPFYYIEYGIAQLGAIGVWKNYMGDKETALAKYNVGQALGATKKLPELFEAFGIPFDFSPERIKQLGEFVYGEWERL